MKNLSYSVLFFLLILLPASTEACTSAIITGRLTVDGRPILWKTRDTETWANSIGYYQGEKYRYVAIVDSKEYASPQRVWGGTNEAGFAIMNTLSYNLANDMEQKDWHHNGLIMKRALEICATVSDFKNLLDTLPRPTHAASNFGVIDAEGGAAYFELGPNNYVMTDVNKIAEGFVVRTNFSPSGRPNHGYGYVRYDEACRQIGNKASTKDITPSWLIRHLSRSFRNPQMGIDLTDKCYNVPVTNGWFTEQDFIARRTSSCAFAIQGVKTGERPELTTFWVALGYPPVTPAVPVWVKYGDNIPAVLRYDASLQTAPSCWYAHHQQQQIYSFSRGDDANHYFHWALLWKEDGSGLMQRTEKREDEMQNRLLPQITAMVKKGKLQEKKVQEIYKYVQLNLWKGGTE